jgi:chemotaxis protein CheD
MRKPPHVAEVVLQPGEFYFGGRGTRICTLLGSCVAITMWHPALLIGGMCHYMLPSRFARTASELDGRYADEAIELFHREIRKAGTKSEEYQVKLFGGGNMFDRQTQDLKKEDCSDVACRNIMAARRLLRHYGHEVTAEHVGMNGHRNVMLDVWSGKVWMRYVGRAQQQNVGGCS